MVSNTLGGGQIHATHSFIAIIIKLIYRKELIWSLTALDMAKLTKIAYFCSLRGKIDFKNLLVLEKNA